MRNGSTPAFSGPTRAEALRNRQKGVQSSRFGRVDLFLLLLPVRSRIEFTMNVAMWGKALRVIPRISHDEWNALDVISKWLIAARSAVLVITFIPACMVGLLALRDGKFDGVLWLIM